jgi:hypothetical protein
MSTLLPIEAVYEHRDNPASEAPKEQPDMLRCQFGMDGPRGSRCENRPIALERGASICADCIVRLRKRGRTLSLTHIEAFRHG